MERSVNWSGLQWLNLNQDLFQIKTYSSICLEGLSNIENLNKHLLGGTPKWMACVKFCLYKFDTSLLNNTLELN